jgi:hypothetical protein
MAYDAKTDYAKLMQDAFAKNDAKAFNTALNTRQEKINALGLTNKVESNQDILNRLNATKTAPTQAVTQATQQPFPQQTKPQYQLPKPADNSAQINQTFNFQLDSLRQAIANSKAKLQNQKSQLPQQYDPLRTSAYTNSKLSAIGNNENLANQGLAGALYAPPTSGTSESSRVAQNVGLGNSLNNINLQQREATNALDNAALDLDTQAFSSEADIRQSLSQALTNEQNRLYDAGVEAAKFNYGASQDIIDNQFRQSQFDYGKQQDTIDNNYRDRAFEESVKQNGIQQGNWQQEFTFREMQQKIENALSQKRIGLDAAQVALQQAKFKADQDPDSLDNQLKKKQLESKDNTNTAVANMTNWVYNTQSNEESLTRLTQNKALILQQLQESGYSGSEALKYYNELLTDLGQYITSQ